MRLVLAVLMVLAAVPAMAQTNPVLVSQPFSVTYEHDGLKTMGYQCWLDGKPQGAQLPSTARSCAIPGLAEGVHTITVTASNAFGTSASSPALTATAGTPPSSPTNLRIVVQVAVMPDGSVTLLASSVSKDPPAAP